MLAVIKKQFKEKTGEKAFEKAGAQDSSFIAQRRTQ